MTAPATIKQGDLERVFKAAIKTELPFTKITVAPDGSIVIINAPLADNDDEGKSGWEDA